MFTVFDPVIAAVAAAVVCVTGPPPPAPSQPTPDPMACTQRSVVANDAASDRIHALVAELTAAARSPGVDPAIRERVHTALPVQLGNASPPDPVVTTGCGVGAEEAQAGLEIAAAAIHLADRIIAAIAAARVVGPPASGQDDGDEGDDEGGDRADPSPTVAPRPTPAPAPNPAPAVPAPGSPAPTVPAPAPAAAMEQMIRELATTLKASSDPAMQKLGDDLLGILGAAPSPAPGAPAPGGSTPAVLPTGATPLFTDDFEGGDLGKWGTCQGAGVNGECAGLTPSDGMGVGEDPERGMVAQFTITDGETAEMGGERSEVRDSGPGTSTKEGDDRWYSWSMKFPEEFPEPDGGYYIVMQWHQSSDSGSPPLALDISQGTIDIGGDGVDAPRRTIGEIRRGEWVDYVLHAGFSQNDGFVEAWENGVQTVQKTSRPTMTDDENYLKMGIYRDEGSTGDAEVWFDDFAIHDGTGGPAPAPDDPPDGGGGEEGGGSGSGDGDGDGGDGGDTDGGNDDGDGEGEGEGEGSAAVEQAAAPARPTRRPAPTR